MINDKKADKKMRRRRRREDNPKILFVSESSNTPLGCIVSDGSPTEEGAAEEIRGVPSGWMNEKMRS